MILINENIVALRTYILENLSQPLSTSELAQRFDLNESTLRKQFRRQYNISLHRFILASRMEAAMTMLKLAQRPVYEVAMLVGYDDPSNFTHAFSKYYGIPPKQVAKNEMNEIDG